MKGGTFHKEPGRRGGGRTSVPNKKLKEKGEQHSLKEVKVESRRFVNDACSPTHMHTSIHVDNPRACSQTREDAVRRE